VSWKYEGIAYSLILKHAGAIMQQLYLVATAIGVAPCSLGVGDSRLFAQATGLNPLRDIPVAEIMLSGAC
jgi:SagB-type dehydrogenase family enzyme